MCNYRSEFNNSIKSQSDREWGKKKKQLIDKYGWVVPNEDCISLLTEPTVVLEVGSGKGYLASVVEDSGGCVYATDKSVPDNTWTDVHSLSLQDIADDPELVPTTDVILTAWPPADSDLGVSIVTELEPSVLYYIGKLTSTITGSEKITHVLDEYEQTHKVSIDGWVQDEYLYRYVNYSTLLSRHRRLP